MSLVERARRAVSGSEDDEDEDAPQRFDDSPRWGPETESLREGLRAAYTYLEDAGTATTEELLDAMAREFRPGEAWWWYRGLPLLHSEPGVTVDGWSAPADPLDDDALEARVTEIYEDHRSAASIVQGLTVAAYRELRERDEELTLRHLEYRAGKRANMSADERVWARVHTLLKRLDVDGPEPWDAVWHYEAPADTADAAEGVN